MSLGNKVDEDKDLTHYHQCGACELSIRVVDPVKAQEYMAGLKTHTVDPDLPYCEAGALYTGPSPFLKAIGEGCGHVWKHTARAGEHSMEAHDCPACGAPNGFRLYGLDLEKLGVALDKVQEFPRAA